MTYRPLAPLLISGYAPDSTRACAIIPARNEERILPRALDALRLQNDLNGRPLPHECYEVILLLNNCTDASQAVAEHYQSAHPTFTLHVASSNLRPEEAHVGTARRMLMDSAYHRLLLAKTSCPAILSTDADTVVAPDWIARNLAALEAGADVVGGVIHLFHEDLLTLRREEAGTYYAYQRDRQLQRLVARLESILDPDLADPWPRHLEHFGASLACTSSIYALAGGLPPVKPLEDVAFIDALRKVGARIRHCPQTHVYTSARFDGRASVGLSGQLKIWQQQCQAQEPHLVDSAEWMEHRFRSLFALRELNKGRFLASLEAYPKDWQSRIRSLHAERLSTPRFLEKLDSNRLIEELFERTGCRRQSDIAEVIRTITAKIHQLTLDTHTQSI